MKHPLEQIARALRQPAPTHGRVTAIRGSIAQVATSSGLITTTVSGSVEVGQKVTLRDGIAYPAPSARQSYPL